MQMESTLLRPSLELPYFPQSSQCSEDHIYWAPAPQAHISRKQTFGSSAFSSSQLPGDCYSHPIPSAAVIIILGRRAVYSSGAPALSSGIDHPRSFPPYPPPPPTYSLKSLDIFHIPTENQQQASIAKWTPEQSNS